MKPADKQKKVPFTSLLILLIISSNIVISCGKPPEDADEKNLLDLMEENLQFMNMVKGDDEKMKKFATELAENFEMIIAFYKDSQINITSSQGIPDEQALAYSLENNEFMVNRPVYVTAEGRDMIFSLDNKTWYSSRNDARKDIEGIYNDYVFTTSRTGQSINVDYSMTLSMGRKPKEVKLKKGREVVTLKEGMIFSHQEQEKITVDLKNKILLVPAGTLIHGSLFIHGNLLNCKQIASKITITSAQDLFIYVKNLMLSLSFDKINWDVSIFSFEVEPSFIVKAVSDDQIYFNVYAHALYNEEAKSTSIVKLLMNMM